MNLENENHVLDAVDRLIVETMEGNARISMTDLARQVGLSAPSVAERVRRLESGGIIRAFTLDVDAGALGYPISAMVRVRPLPGKLHLVERLIQQTAQFVECDKITGDDPFLARMVVRSIAEMDEVLEALSDHAVTSTAVIKSSAFKRRLPPL